MTRSKEKKMKKMKTEQRILDSKEQHILQIIQNMLQVRNDAEKKK